MSQQSYSDPGTVIFSDLREMVAALSLKIGLLATKIDDFERRLDGLEALHNKIESLGARMQNFESLLFIFDVSASIDRSRELLNIF